MRKSAVLHGESPEKSKYFEAALYGLFAATVMIMTAAAIFENHYTFIAVGGSVFLLGIFALFVYAQKKNIAVSAPANVAAVLLAAGIVIRLVLAACIFGYQTDIDCFVGWSYYAYAGGLDHFYTGGFFADYPPLYMYVLYFLGMLQSVFSISANVFLIKLPAIAFDVVVALLFYKAAKKKLDKTQSLLIFACLILNPALMANSAAWGQIDIIYTLMAVICVYLLMKEKYALSVVVFILALLLKVQAILLAPILLYVFARGIFKKESRRKTLSGFLIGCAAGAGIALALILPFSGGRPISWIFDLYLNSLGGYAYVTINGFNLYGLLGLNWTPVGTLFLGLPFNVWGYIAIAVVCVYAAWLYRLNPKGNNLFGIAAFITLGVYMFSHSMHERYLFAAPVLLLMAYIRLKDKKLFYASLFTFGALLFNQCVALQYYNQWIPYNVMAWVSALNLISFIYAAVVITKNAAYHHKNKDIRLVSNEDKKNFAEFHN